MMSYGSYARNSPFPPPSSGGGGIAPLTAVVVASITLDPNVPTPLSDLVTNPGNSVDAAWQMNDTASEVQSNVMWRTQPGGYAGTGITSAMSQCPVGGPYPFILRGFTADGAYADFAVALTVVNNP